MNLKRLETELAGFQKDPPPGCKVSLVNGDLTHWKGIIEGPKLTPFEGGIFHLDIVFPPDYPFRPPICKFDTKIFHPNISQKGDICLDTLKDNWVPVLTTAKMMLSISSLLDDPNPTDPLNSDAALLLKQNAEAYDQKVRQWVSQYAHK